MVKFSRYPEANTPEFLRQFLSITLMVMAFKTTLYFFYDRNRLLQKFRKYENN